MKACFVVSLKFEFNWTFCVSSGKSAQGPSWKNWQPTPFSWGRVSGEGLTADNRSVILDGVFIVVHVGVAALVIELLVAAVMGVAAPRGR